MLKSFSVSNFKQFKNVSIDFTDVRDYKFSNECIKDGFIKNAVIYGKNSSGKTNFGLAIMDIVNHLTDNEKLPLMYTYFLNADNVNEAARFKYEFEFEGSNVVYEYQKLDMTTLVSEKLIINNDLIFDFDFIAQKFNEENINQNFLPYINWEYRSKEMSILKYLAVNTIVGMIPSITKLMAFVNGMLWFRRVDEANNFVGFKTFAEFNDLIKFVIDNNYVKELEKFFIDSGVNEKLEVKNNIDGTKSLFFVHKEQYLPFGVASSGTKALLLFFTWYKQFKDVSFVIIDEFDAFYHYALSEKIVKLLMSKVQTQVLLTSHNTNLLSNRIMRPDCYFILNEKGLISFANATGRELREGNNLEKLFIGGEFGE